MANEVNHSGSHQRLMMVDNVLEKQIDARFRETMTALASEFRLFISMVLSVYIWWSHVAACEHSIIMNTLVY
jgi:hypothetical protein